ncbi:MAG: PD-(D/E)XK nuclease family protein, partial [Vallitaleaceae bacterium]|nr:PD-(D/E)XK nuclease family protein [Vallitaleaceae bacterium]
DVISKDFSYESIFRYLKSGLLETKVETLDALENYVLAYGIRGLKTWQQKWEKPYPLWKGDPDAEHTKKMLDEMNLLKYGLLEPLIQFKKDLKKESSTVASITKAVFNWMRTLRLEEKMTEQEVFFEKQGNLLYQKEYAQIYKMIVDVLDQTVEILGDSAIVLKEYANLLQAGLEECEMGLVPPGLDQVVIGDLERTRLKEVKALFVVGFNEGKIPKKVSDANILTDYERQQLKALGIALAPDNKENIFKEQFSLYMGLLRVSKKLYLSYAKSDLQGKPMRPSLLFYTIKKMYPKINVLDLEEIYRNRLIVNRPKPTFQHLIGNQRSSNEIGEKDENVQAYRWFMAQEVWRPVVLALQEASKVSNHESALSPEMVEFLYGKELKNSVSRLETYARCPFAHFIDFGLHLRERLDYTVKMPDIGILFHRAIDLCSRKIDQRGFDWKTLEASVRDELVEQSVLEVVGEEQRGLFGGNARNAYLVKRLTRITKRAVWAISQQISKGEFKPTDYELSFDGSKNPLEALTIDFKDQKSMHLSGRIDRMDTYENEEALYLSVIDYKSGNQNFDLVALYYGLQLQLLVYLSAASELKKGPTTPKVTPAGVFYFHID